MKVTEETNPCSSSASWAAPLGTSLFLLQVKCPRMQQATADYSSVPLWAAGITTEPRHPAVKSEVAHRSKEAWVFWHHTHTVGEKNQPSNAARVPAPGRKQDLHHFLFPGLLGAPGTPCTPGNSHSPPRTLWTQAIQQSPAQPSTVHSTQFQAAAVPGAK